MTTNASEIVIGGELSQEGYTVTYVSRRLSAAESRDSNIERETLVKVYVISRPGHFLQVQNFKLLFDHKLLVFFFPSSKEFPKAALARTFRWAISSIDFDFDVVCQESRKNPHTVSISLLQVENKEDDELEATIVYNEVNSAACKSKSLDELKMENLVYHSLIQTAIKRIISIKRSDCCQQELTFKKLAHFENVENDILYSGTQGHLYAFIPPGRLRRSVIEGVEINATSKTMKLTSCFSPLSRILRAT